jgi:hypothetical protein
MPTTKVNGSKIDISLLSSKLARRLLEAEVEFRCYVLCYPPFAKNSFERDQGIFFQKRNFIVR